MLSLSAIASHICTEIKIAVIKYLFFQMKKCNANKIHPIVLVSFLLIILNYYYPIFRFTNLLANYFGGLIFCLSPMFLFYNSAYLSHNFLELLSAIIFIPLSLLFLVILLFVIIDISNKIMKGKDYSFENIHKIMTGDFDIKIYRSNGGATTAFGIIVRQEREILPGLLLVKELYPKYDCDDIKYKMDDKKTLLIDNYQLGSSTSIKLNDWIYF